MDEIEQLKLLDVTSRSSLQSLQDSFSDATGMAAVTMDISGEITKWSHLSELSTVFMKRLPEDHNRFVSKACEDAKRSGHAVVYDTYLGFTEFVIPISLKGKVLGYVLGGQVLTEKLHESSVRKFAATHGFDANSLYEMFAKVDQVPETRVAAAAELLMSMVNNALDFGYQRALSAERSRAVREGTDENGADSEIRDKINTTVEFVSNVERGCEQIKNSVADSTKAVDSTDSIVKTIENSSTQLTLIGFNASIEAKRAGAAGAGFNVIAQEVRTLAEKNSKQAGEIEHTLNGIKKSMGYINNQIRGLYTDIEKIVDSINDLSCVVIASDNNEG